MKIIRDEAKAEKHILKSIQTLDKSINNIMSAIEQGGAREAVAALLQRIESLQKEKTELHIELTDIKKEHGVVPRISENDIIDRVNSLDSFLKIHV